MSNKSEYDTSIELAEYEIQELKDKCSKYKELLMSLAKSVLDMPTHVSLKYFEKDQIISLWALEKLNDKVQ